MVVNDYVCGLIKRGALAIFASEFAPTGAFTPACANPEIVNLGPNISALHDR